jgi:membrane protein
MRALVRRVLAAGRLFTAAARQWWNDDAFRMSASLAFYTIFSIAPSLLIAVAVASAVFGQDAARRQLLAEIESLVGPDGARVAAQLLRGAPQSGESPLAIALGAGMAVLGSTAVFADLKHSLNQIWGVQAVAGRGPLWDYLRNRLLAFTIVLGLGFLLLASLGASALLGAAREILDERAPRLPGIWLALGELVPFALAAALFAAIYKVLPDVLLRWREVAVGAGVTAVLFALGTHAIGFYLAEMAFASRYGAAGSFVALLTWVYYSALICFYGAEFTRVYTRRARPSVEATAHAVPIPRSQREGARAGSGPGPQPVQSEESGV